MIDETTARIQATIETRELCTLLIEKFLAEKTFGMNLISQFRMSRVGVKMRLDILLTTDTISEEPYCQLIQTTMQEERDHIEIPFPVLSFDDFTLVTRIAQEFVPSSDLLCGSRIYGHFLQNICQEMTERYRQIIRDLLEDHFTTIKVI